MKGMLVRFLNPSVSSADDDVMKTDRAQLHHQISMSGKRGGGPKARQPQLESASDSSDDGSDADDVATSASDAAVKWVACDSCGQWRK